MISVCRATMAASVVMLGFIASSALADDGQKLTKDELIQIVPGSRVVSTSSRGYIRSWTNDSSGSFVANWQTPPGDKSRSGAAQGTWKVNDKGQYCAHIEWEQLQTENWCAFLQQNADGTYGMASDGHSTWVPATFKLSK